MTSTSFSPLLIGSCLDGHRCCTDPLAPLVCFSPLLIGSCLDGDNLLGYFAHIESFSPLLIGSCLDGGRKE